MTVTATEADYGPVRDSDELDRQIEIMTWSFGIPREDLLEFYARVGRENTRVLREDGRITSALTLIPMGQFFGGRAVPMTGVNLVGAAPEARGRGGATRLMEASVREMHAAGVPISTLYPAKQTLYRRVGWEIAGARWELTVPVRDLERKSRDLTVRRADKTDEPAVQALYRRVAERHNGTVDRTAFMWRRITDPLKPDVKGFVAEGKDGPEAYVYLRVTRQDGSMRQELQAADLLAATPAGAKRLLAFLGDHDSLADRIVWHGNPADPLLGHMREYLWKTRTFFPWMIRVLDPRAALEARGWPAGMGMELHFEVEDPVLPQNTGRFVLEIAGGAGRVRHGGDGRIRCHVRGLAALYAGWHTPETVRTMGLLDGDPAEMAKAQAAFAGPTPWMSDMF